MRLVPCDARVGDPVGAMSRFDCPSCGKSLRFRLLRHVPLEGGPLAFSCAHCGAVLKYTENVRITHVPFGTPLRRVSTFVVGLVLLSFIAEKAGPLWKYAAIAAAAAVLAGAHLFSSKPAYEVVTSNRREQTSR
jgi:predicted RNA-binding Zn-ribbon protein involved in translation (DUF1610 family)